MSTHASQIHSQSHHVEKSPKRNVRHEQSWERDKPKCSHTRIETIFEEELDQTLVYWQRFIVNSLQGLCQSTFVRASRSQQG